MYLNANQHLFAQGQKDSFVYIVLFGSLSLRLIGQSALLSRNPDLELAEEVTELTLGHVNIGWTIGEEVLFDINS